MTMNKLFLYIIAFTSLIFISSQVNAESINKIKVSMPGWVMSGLGDSVVQLFILDHNKKITFNQGGAITDEQLSILENNPSDLKGETSKTFDNMAMIIPDLLPEIEDSLKETTAFVVISVTADPGMFKKSSDPTNPCPPCRDQTNKLQNITNPNLKIFHLELGM